MNGKVGSGSSDPDDGRVCLKNSDILTSEIIILVRERDEHA